MLKNNKPFDRLLSDLKYFTLWGHVNYGTIKLMLGFADVYIVTMCGAQRGMVQASIHGR